MKKKHLLQFLFSIAAVIGLNILASQYFFRIDLTEEGRYTLSPISQEILENLQGDIVIEVYLEGNLPRGFQKLRQTIEETLDEFKVYAGNRISYSFVDPNDTGGGDSAVVNFKKDLFMKGVFPSRFGYQDGDERVQVELFPGAVLQYFNEKDNKTYEISAAFLEAGSGSGLSEAQLNQSEENVEYHLISAIQKLIQEKRKRVGFVVGHGELPDIEVASAYSRLQEFYEVVKVPLPLVEEIKEGLDALIVAKPDTAFSEPDKFKIDQYIMKGGKTLFFVDVVGLHVDSVLQGQGAFTYPVEHNLLDMFFKYGVRLNPNVIKDLNASPLPFDTGNEVTPGQKDYQLIPWQYYPIINTFGKHPIVKNLSPIESKFISTIDTIKSPGIRKTPLLFTSKFSKIRNTPAYVTYEEERTTPNPDEYTAGPQPVAFLLEGEFTSIYKSRSYSQAQGFIEKSPATKILICSDGDLIRNEVTFQTQDGQPQPLRLGYNKYIRQVFANSDFLLNAVNYMVDEKGVISARNKEITLRPLDRKRVRDERSYWQALNLLLPILIVSILGVAIYFIRRYWYT